MRIARRSISFAMTPFPMRRRTILLTVLTTLPVVLASSCQRETSTVAGKLPAAAMAAQAPERPVVDSARPIEESLRRFRQNLAASVELANAERSRDAVVRRFIRAVERSDTTDLREMVLSRSEFAWLYYPTSPHTRPPTIQPPELVWFLHLENSQKGVTRVLARFGGRSLRVRGYTCALPPRTEDGNTVWDDCLLHLGAGRDTTSFRLFGGVIERAGRYKLFSYSNDL